MRKRRAGDRSLSESFLRGSADDLSGEPDPHTSTDIPGTSRGAIRGTAANSTATAIQFKPTTIQPSDNPVTMHAGTVGEGSRLEPLPYMCLHPQKIPG